MKFGDPERTKSHTDSVKTIVLMRFANVPDTASVTRVELGLRIHGAEQANLRITAYEVDSTSTWTESKVHWSNRPATIAVDDTSGLIVPSPGDTAYYKFYPGAVLLPHQWLQVWKRNPTTGGLALEISQQAPDGSLDILSRDTLVTNASGLGLLNPRLRVFRGASTDTLNDRAPTEDAYVYQDDRPPASGTEPLLYVADWLPTRAVLRFDLRALPRKLPRGVTINRAMLRLTLASPAAGDTFELGASAALAAWSEGSEPDSMTSGLTSGLASLPLHGADAARGRITLDIGPLVQAELGDTTGGIKLLGDSVNVQVRAVGEAKQGHRIAVYSREAPDDSTRPTLDLIYTAPLPPRWDTSTRSQAP